MLDGIRRMGANLKRPRLFVFALGLLTALLVTLVVWPRQSAVTRFDDPYSFAAFGRGIAEGRGFVQVDHPDLPTMRRAPVYPSLIALLYLVGGPRTMLVRLFQCLVAGGTALLAFEIGRRMFSKEVGLIAGILCAFHPMILRYVPDIQVECVLTFLMTLMVWCGVRFVQKPSFSAGLALGAAGALGALVKGVLLVCPPIFGAFWLVRQWRRGEAWSLGPVAAIAVAMCLLILPWTARNYKASGGHFILISTNAGGEFLRGYVFAQPKYYLLRQPPYTDGENEANQMEIDLFKSKNLVWQHDETETERVLGEAAKAKLKAEPVAFVKKGLIGLFSFWYVLTSRMNSLVVAGCAAGAWALALLGWRRARLEKRELWPLLQPILTLNLLYAAMLALGRYSAPTIPTLMVLAAWGIVTLVDRRGAAVP